MRYYRILARYDGSFTVVVLVQGKDAADAIKNFKEVWAGGYDPIEVTLTDYEDCVRVY